MTHLIYLVSEMDNCDLGSDEYNYFETLVNIQLDTMLPDSLPQKPQIVKDVLALGMIGISNWKSFLQ